MQRWLHHVRGVPRQGQADGPGRPDYPLRDLRALQQPGTPGKVKHVRCVFCTGTAQPGSVMCEQCLSVGKGCSMVPKVRVDTVVGMIDLDGLHVHTTAFESELNSEAARKASRDCQKAVHDGTTSTLHSTTRSKQAQVPPKPALCSQQCLFAAAPCRHVRGQCTKAAARVL